MDKLATELGVQPLSSFLSYDPGCLRSVFGAVIGMPPAVRHFDAGDALTTARAMRARLEQSPPDFAVISEQDRTADLIRDLANCEEVFRAAQEHGARVRCWIAE